MTSMQYYSFLMPVVGSFRVSHALPKSPADRGFVPLKAIDVPSTWTAAIASMKQSKVLPSVPIVTTGDTWNLSTDSKEAIQHGMERNMYTFCSMDADVLSKRNRFLWEAVNGMIYDFVNGCPAGEKGKEEEAALAWFQKDPDRIPQLQRWRVCAYYMNIVLAIQLHYKEFCWTSVREHDHVFRRQTRHTFESLRLDWEHIQSGLHEATRALFPDDNTTLIFNDFAVKVLFPPPLLLSPQVSGGGMWSVFSHFNSDAVVGHFGMHFANCAGAKNPYDIHCAYVRAVTAVLNFALELQGYGGLVSARSYTEHLIRHVTQAWAIPMMHWLISFLFDIPEKAWSWDTEYLLINGFSATPMIKYIQRKIIEGDSEKISTHFNVLSVNKLSLLTVFRHWWKSARSLFYIARIRCGYNADNDVDFKLRHVCCATNASEEADLVSMLDSHTVTEKEFEDVEQKVGTFVHHLCVPNAEDMVLSHITNVSYTLRRRFVQEYHPLFEYIVRRSQEADGESDAFVAKNHKNDAYWHLMIIAQGMALFTDEEALLALIGNDIPCPWLYEVTPSMEFACTWLEGIVGLQAECDAPSPFIQQTQLKMFVLFWSGTKQLLRNFEAWWANLDLRHATRTPVTLALQPFVTEMKRLCELVGVGTKYYLERLVGAVVAEDDVVALANCGRDENGLR